MNFSLLIHRFYAIPIKIPPIFVEINKLNLKFIWKCKCQCLEDPKQIWKYRKIFEVLTLRDFKIFYKATSLKRIWYCHKNRYKGKKKKKTYIHMANDIWQQYQGNLVRRKSFQQIVPEHLNIHMLKKWTSIITSCCIQTLT